ncbi:MAG: DegT/DnrJ/EryC1/StrS family aminotransferase [Phycisphaeraceae bacterium]|nr:DegT/DnrJ/EryC1/StrS family aminotransferase [Phycisphaeraceae bacterium]
MSTLSAAAGRLAIAGGTPAAQGLVCPPWPPTDSKTEQRLIEIYRSRAWSFGGAAEMAFAQNYARYHGAKHGIFMANGTVTLQTALLALGIKPGDEVIVPALTWLATAMAVRYVGAVPVFVDIDAETLCMDPAAFEAAITPRTQAVIPVHLYGSLADLERILAIAKKRNLFVVEDCAHMQGGKWAGRGVGSWGDVGSFSFQQSKTVASGEGGICLTNDDDLAERIYRAKHIGYAAQTKQGQAASGPPEGLLCHNFRATEFQAAILDGQLEGLAALIDRYNVHATRLEARVAEVAHTGLHVQARGRKASPQGYYAFTMLADRGEIGEIPMNVLRDAFAAEGFGFGGTYGTVYTHMLWNLPKTEFRFGGPCPVADGPVTSRALTFAHQWLGADTSTIDRIGDTIVKVASRLDDLRRINPSSR